MNKFTIIPDWPKRNLRCYFCGETRSVKYAMKIHDPVISEEDPTVCVCNKCALLKASDDTHNANKNELLANEIYSWCKKHHLWGDNIIYFNGKALASFPEWNGEQGKQLAEDLYEYENRNPKDYFEYANPETVSMSFEGPLYSVLNGYVRGWTKREEELNKIFEKYGYYFEYGNAWNLSAYDI